MALPFSMMKSFVALLIVLASVTEAFQTSPHHSSEPRYVVQVRSGCRKERIHSGSRTSGRRVQGRHLLTELDMATLYPVSSVDSLPIIQQQLIFAGIFMGLGVGTTGLLKGFDVVEQALPDGWFAKWRTTWPLLGIVYVAAGLAHFGVQDAFMSIYPPQGTWGLWYLPGSPEFHVAWTGIAEFLGGLGLLLGGFCSSFVERKEGNNSNIWVKLTKLSAGSLALLTVAVSPANIYMYTHGAIMIGAGPDGPLELQFHAIRFVAQILLLSLFTGIVTSSPSQEEESTNEA